MIDIYLTIMLFFIILFICVICVSIYRLYDQMDKINVSINDVNYIHDKLDMYKDLSNIQESTIDNIIRKLNKYKSKQSFDLLCYIHEDIAYIYENPWNIYVYGYVPNLHIIYILNNDFHQFRSVYAKVLDHQLKHNKNFIINYVNTDNIIELYIDSIYKEYYEYNLIKITFNLQ